MNEMMRKDMSNLLMKVIPWKCWSWKQTKLMMRLNNWLIFEELEALREESMLEREE